MSTHLPFTERTLLTSLASLVRAVPVTIGPRDITLKVPNLSTLSSMSSDERPRLPTAYKVSRSPTLSVVVLVPVWVHF